jgi:hypothetical protein
LRLNTRQSRRQLFSRRQLGAGVGNAALLGHQFGLNVMGLGAVGVGLQHLVHHGDGLVHLSGAGGGIDIAHAGFGGQNRR